MSELGATYYAERAERLELRLPGILNGEPVPLSDPGWRLPLHDPESSTHKAVILRYESAVNSVGNFVTKGYQKVHTESPQESLQDYINQRRRRRHSDTILQKLAPGRKILAGNITDITLEAIAASEVSPVLLAKAHSSMDNKHDVEIENNAVYFRLSGELYVGRTLGSIACLTVASPTLLRNYRNEPLIGMRLDGFAGKITNSLAQSGLWQSSAVSTVMDEYNLAQPLSQGFEGSRRHH